ncbi:MAG: phenylacetate--CoA ligase family protein [Candidatus Binataceae bacterium]
MAIAKSTAKIASKKNVTGRRLNSAERWTAVLRKYMRGLNEPGGKRYWAPDFETAPRTKIRDIQNEKLAAMLPYLYEHSPFYRARFGVNKLRPADIKTVADLIKFPITTKHDMTENVNAFAPWGTYTTVDERRWRESGWMVFSTSGTTATPRPFRYTQLDRELWAITSARSMYAMGIRAGDFGLTCTTYNPHVFFWSVHYGWNLMRVGIIPGGVPTERRVAMIENFKPTVIAATPSYALHLANAMREAGFDPARSSIKRLVCAGEPASGIPSTRKRIEQTWNAQFHDVYGCTEAVPAGWAFTCEQGLEADPVSTHVPEDLQIWETVDPRTFEPVAEGERGLTVVTNLNSEGSPQLRFLIGDFTILDQGRCVCGRTLARARGGFVGRADDMLNVRGITLFPTAIEEVVRGFDAVGDEFQIVLETEGVMDTLTIVAETAEALSAGDGDELRVRLAAEISRRCEIRPRVELVAAGSLPKTEFKAKRVIDRRQIL